VTSISFGLLFLKENVVLDVLHAFLSLLSLKISLVLNCFNLSLSSGLDLTGSALSLSLLLSYFLSLLGNLESSLLSFDLLVVAHQIIWNFWLGDSNGNDFNTRSPSCSTFRQSFCELLIQSVEVINENFL